MMYRFHATLLASLLLFVNPAWAITVDRNYELGDYGPEGAVLNGEVGANFTNVQGDRFTADSLGIDNSTFVDYQDLQVFGAPHYRDVSARPIITSGLGVEFDGIDDRLEAAPLNIPEESAAAVPGFPFIYAGLKTRGLQMWVRPDASALGTPENPTARQGIVMDTIAMGGVSITADGKWTQVNSNHPTDVSPPATVAVVGNSWHHVMHHVYESTDAGAPRVVPGTGGSLAYTGVVYVNGIAVSANNDAISAGDLTAGGRVGRLSVGAEEVTGDGVTPAFGNYFKGTIDNLEMYVYGDNSEVPGGMDYGTFDLFADNDWIENEILTTVPGGILEIGDVNKNGAVSGNGTGSAAVDDVTAFVEGWLNQNRIVGAHNTVIVGDWLTWDSGDMNHDGITDLRDWAIINAANPSMGGAIAAALGGATVPEPGSVLLAGLACLTVGTVARRRKAARRAA